MADVNNKQIAAVFERIADVMDILGEDAFRVNSYRKVARIVSECAQDVAALSRAGEVTQLRGVGKRSAEVIAEIVDTGECGFLAELLEDVPPGLIDLLQIQGLGPKTISKFWRQADVTDKASLADAIEDGLRERILL